MKNIKQELDKPKTAAVILSASGLILLVIGSFNGSNVRLQNSLNAAAIIFLIAASIQYGKHRNGI